MFFSFSLSSLLFLLVFFSSSLIPLRLWRCCYFYFSLFSPIHRSLCTGQREWLFLFISLDRMSVCVLCAWCGNQIIRFRLFYLKQKKNRNELMSFFLLRFGSKIYVHLKLMFFLLCGCCCCFYFNLGSVIVGVYLLLCVRVTSN